MPFLAITFPAIDPVAISIGPLAIRWYALAYICGIVIGWIYARALIRSEKKGRVRTCRLQPGVLASAEQWLVDRRSEWEQRHDRFEEYVMTLKDKENDQ